MNIVEIKPTVRTYHTRTSWILRQRYICCCQLNLEQFVNECHQYNDTNMHNKLDTSKMCTRSFLNRNNSASLINIRPLYSREQTLHSCSVHLKCTTRLIVNCNRSDRSRYISIRSWTITHDTMAQTVEWHFIRITTHWQKWQLRDNKECDTRAEMIDWHFTMKVTHWHKWQTDISQSIVTAVFAPLSRQHQTSFDMHITNSTQELNKMAMTQKNYSCIMSLNATDLNIYSTQLSTQVLPSRVSMSD